VAVALHSTARAVLSALNVSDPWSVWNATSVATGGNLYPWPQWNITYTSGTLPVHNITSSTTTLAVLPWEAWNTSYTLAVMNQPAPVPVLTAEERAARDAALAEQARQADARRVQQRAARLRAEARAEELLTALLSDEQLRTYRQHGWFEVRGSGGGRWRIRTSGQAGNVDLMPETGSERDASFCCHPPGQLPAADAHLAQMLHLVTDEDGFRRTANVAWRRRPLRAA
jgi:hypothetical protein